MSFFQIPGNIKQQYSPFNLNPSSVKTGVNNSTELEGQSPQQFSYKTSGASSCASGFQHLQIYPSSLDSLKINNDISFKANNLGIKDVLNTLPSIQIREFLPDTRLDQCINVFIDFFKNMSKLFSGDDDKSGADSDAEKKPPENDKSLFDKIQAAAWFTIKYMVGKSAANLYTDMGYQGSSTDRYVMHFPWSMYYEMQSCTTTNIYEFPCVSDGKDILHSGDGMAGWTGGGDDIMSAGGFRLSSLLGKIPVVGSLANMILGNIGINYLPWWNPTSGTSTKEPEITIKLDLFNDSLNAALANFLFVHTIVPSNKWIQYNMFQHSSNIYDIRLQGINRLFACAGNFDVTYDGVLRSPSSAFISELKKYQNSNVVKSDLNDLIRIPDIYHVNMRFQSLLPANFNNYIYAWAKNNSITTEYSNTGYTAAKMQQRITTGLAGYATKVKAVWDSANDNLYG